MAVAVVYIDDVLLSSQTLEEHVKLVCNTLKTPACRSLFVKLSKCEFHKTELSFKVSAAGIGMGPSKVNDVVNWEAPKTRQ